ncbi:MAG: UvrD-helicase domain-containing protein [Rhodospirillales bacterium]
MPDLHQGGGGGDGQPAFQTAGAWTTTDDPALNEELSGLLDRAPETEEILRARALFAAALDAPGGMHIRTIHSFCESLLGRFPLEAGIAPNFRVADEHAQKEIVKSARAGIFERAGHPRGDARLKAAFEAAAGRMDAGGFDELMAAMVGARGELTDILRTHGGPDGVMAHVRAALGVDPGETPESVIAAAVRGADENLVERLAEAWTQGAKTDKQRALDARAWLALAEETRIAHWDNYAFCFLTKKRRRAARVMTKNAAESDAGALALAEAEQGRVFAAAERVRAVRCADHTESLVRISAALTADYETRKQAMAALDYDDLIFKARDLLQSDGGAGWVHYKLDGGLTHVLIDESQDTSPEQWAVIESLVSEFFAGEGAHEAAGGDGAPRTMFAVGDAKQSIYGFQGADPEHTARVKAHLRTQAGRRNAGLKTSGWRFRSARHLRCCARWTRFSPMNLRAKAWAKRR